MGPSDLIKPVIERRFEGTIYFGRVSMRPGKPTTFASIPLPDKEKRGQLEGDCKFLFALPGNPASALVTFHVLVVPTLRRLGGGRWRGVSVTETSLTGLRCSRDNASAIATVTGQVSD